MAARRIQDRTLTPSPDVPAPIIFCHYGDSDYLRFTLRAAVTFNPAAAVVLLGDEANAGTAREEGAQHFPFAKYGSDELARFDRVYRFVAGARHGKEAWTKFVFQRWFHVHAFCAANGIERFWHFDSDNLILSDLGARERNFAGYDCTEQCNGSCMNGLVNSFEVVDGYVRTINELFDDVDYLERQADDFAKYPDFAFTEMRAYVAYKEQARLRTIRLNTVIDGETFDECISQEHGMETYDSRFDGHPVKKLFHTEDGFFYERTAADKRFVRIDAINLSWVPTYLFAEILERASMSEGKTPPARVDESDLRLLDVFAAPIGFRLRRLPGKLKRRIGVAAR